MATIESLQAEKAALEAKLTEKNTEIESSTTRISQLNGEAQAKRHKNNELQTKIDELTEAQKAQKDLMSDWGHKINPSGDPKETLGMIEQKLFGAGNNDDTAALRTELSRLNEINNVLKNEKAALEGVSVEFETFRTQTLGEKINASIQNSALVNDVDQDKLPHFVAFANTQIKEASINEGSILVNFNGEPTVKLEDAIQRLATDEKNSFFLNAKLKGLGANKGDPLATKYKGGEVSLERMQIDPEYAREVEASVMDK